MVIIVPADGLAPKGARSSAGIMMAAQSYTWNKPMVQTGNLTQTLHSGVENGGYNSEAPRSHLYSCGYFNPFNYGI